MKNIQEIISELDGSISIIIDHGNGEFTSMPKAHYDELQKQADQPIGGNIK
jgi:hypothetical protein